MTLSKLKNKRVIKERRNKKIYQTFTSSVSGKGAETYNYLPIYTIGTITLTADDTKPIPICKEDHVKVWGILLVRYIKMLSCVFNALLGRK